MKSSVKCGKSMQKNDGRQIFFLILSEHKQIN